MTSTFAGAAAASGSWAVPERRPGQHPGRHGLDDLLGERVASSRRRGRSSSPATGAANLHGAGSLAANPVVVNGVVYMQDLYANVYAISLATGKLKWEYQVNIPEKTGPGPNGVAVADGGCTGTRQPRPSR